MKYDATIANRYDSARHLPEPTMRLWLDAIRRHVPATEVGTILDVGCGTGRFSAALAETFDAHVIGVDASPDMLAKARNNTSDPRVQYRQGSAESLPTTDNSTDLIFMSMVYHHLADPPLAGREFARVLRPGGFVGIRNSTKDLLAQVPYLKYFPSAMDANHHRLPSQQELVDTICGSGLALLAHEVIAQQFADSLSEYCRKISERGLSDLIRLSNAEFNAGLQRMRDAIERNEVSQPVLEPIDLFVFKKHSDHCGNHGP